MVLLLALALAARLEVQAAGKDPGLRRRSGTMTLPPSVTRPQRGPERDADLAGTSRCDALPLAEEFSVSVSALRRPSSREKRRFDLPADSGPSALRRFTDQSGHSVEQPIGALDKVRTHGVKGRYTSLQALNRMLNGTGFHAVQDRKTHMLVIEANRAD